MRSAPFLALTTLALHGACGERRFVAVIGAPFEVSVAASQRLEDEFLENPLADGIAIGFRTRFVAYDHAEVRLGEREVLRYGESHAALTIHSGAPSGADVNPSSLRMPLEHWACLEAPLRFDLRRWGWISDDAWARGQPSLSRAYIDRCLKSESLHWSLRRPPHEPRATLTVFLDCNVDDDRQPYLTVRFAFYHDEALDPKPPPAASPTP